MPSVKKNCPPKADMFNKATSSYYGYLKKAYPKKEADKYWRRRFYGLYDYEKFTKADLEKINNWADKINAGTL